MLFDCENSRGSMWNNISPRETFPENRFSDSSRVPTAECDLLLDGSSVHYWAFLLSRRLDSLIVLKLKLLFSILDSGMFKYSFVREYSNYLNLFIHRNRILIKKLKKHGKKILEYWIIQPYKFFIIIPFVPFS